MSAPFLTSCHRTFQSFLSQLCDFSIIVVACHCFVECMFSIRAIELRCSARAPKTSLAWRSSVSRRLVARSRNNTAPTEVFPLAIV